MIITFLLIVTGFILLIIGAHWLVGGASSLAKKYKVSDLAIGNIIGSNIFNILFILGLSSLVSPLTYNKVLNMDIFLLTIGTLILFFAMFTSEKKKLDRWEASLMVMIYIFYNIYMLHRLDQFYWINE